MEIILLSGGSGKRLWPLSNQVRSKQFLKLLSTEDNDYESMLQRVCRQLDSVGLLSSTHILTCQNQLDMVQNQLKHQVPIICEPSRKGTFSAISLAIAYLYSVLKADPEETICVLPVDAFMELPFFQLLKKVPDILHQSEADFALLGVKPTFPSDQFGYIVAELIGKSDYYSITQFIEKPNRRKARNLMKKNALWNCGVFVFSLRFMINYLKNKSLPTVYDQMLEIYNQLPEISFDYEVAEQSSRSIVIPYDGVWKDVGNWQALSEQMDAHIIGAGELSEDSVNTHIVNELSQPIQVIGISNSMIVAGPDGILIANKKRCSEVKKLVKDDRPMYEEKRWGSYRVLERSQTIEQMESLTKIVKVLPGRNISYQLHYDRQEIWTVISGKGEVILNDQLRPIKAGDVIQIPIGAKHSVKAITPLEFIEVQLGVRLVEEDILRITYSWEEAIQCCK